MPQINPFFVPKSRRAGRAGRRVPQRGLTLIELMVSITIGLILLTGLVALFARQSNTQLELDKSSRQIENGRYAMQLLQEDLQMAGYYGEYSEVTRLPVSSTMPNPCSVNVTVMPSGYNPNDPAAFTNWTDPNALTYLPIALPVAIQGYNAPGATLPADIAGCLDAANHLDGTDILVIRRVDTEEKVASLTTGEIYFQSGLIPPTNLELAFKLTSTASTTLDPAVFTLKKKDPADTTPPPTFIAAPLRKYLVHIYYVSPCSVMKTGQSTCTADADNGQPIPTLKRLELSAASNAPQFQTVPLVEGIENLQIDYGVDSDGDGSPDAYAATPASDIDWVDVMAVRLHLLARNNERTHDYQDKKVYDLGLAGQAATAAASAASATITLTDDKFKRRVFTQLVRLVNPSARREKE